MKWCLDSCTNLQEVYTMWQCERAHELTYCYLGASYVTDVSITVHLSALTDLEFDCNAPGGRYRIHRMTHPFATGGPSMSDPLKRPIPAQS